MLARSGQIIYYTSVLQIDCITEIRLADEKIVAKAWKGLVHKLPSYAKSQHTFNNKMNQVDSLKEELKKTYLTLKNESNDALKGYNSRLMVKEVGKISGQLEELKDLEKRVSNTQDDIISNSS